MGAAPIDCTSMAVVKSSIIILVAVISTPSFTIIPVPVTGSAPSKCTENISLFLQLGPSNFIQYSVRDPPNISDECIFNSTSEREVAAVPFMCIPLLKLPLIRISSAFISAGFPVIVAIFFITVSKSESIRDLRPKDVVESHRIPIEEVSVAPIPFM